MPVHIGSKKINSIHVGTKKVLTTWIGTHRVYSASTLSMLIDGYTEVSGNNILSANTPLKFAGENLWDEIWELGVLKLETGENYPNNNFIRSTNFIGVKPNTQYTFNHDTRQTVIFFYGNNKQYLGTRLSNPSLVVFRIPNNCYYIRFYTQITTYENDTMLNEGNTALPYEPYHETLYNPTVGFSLNAVNEVKDTFETISGKLIKRTGIRDYQDGDENNPDVVTNGTVTIYKLTEPVEYDKLTKTLPQWVKHVFDSSGRELEATITE